MCSSTRLTSRRSWPRWLPHDGAWISHGCGRPGACWRSPSPPTWRVTSRGRCTRSWAADGFYLLFYPLLRWGVLRFPASRLNVSERLRLGLDLAVVAIGGTAVVIYVVLGATIVRVQVFCRDFIMWIGG